MELMLIWGKFREKCSSSDYKVQNLPLKHCVWHRLIFQPLPVSLSLTFVLRLSEYLRISLNRQRGRVQARLFIISWCQCFSCCQATENVKKQEQMWR